MKERRLKELCGSKSHKECQSSHPTAGLTNPHFEGQPTTKGLKPEQGSGGVIQEGKGGPDVEHPLVDAEGDHELVDEAGNVKQFLSAPVW